MNLKRAMFYMFIAFCVFFVIQSPNEAAKLVKVTGEHAGDWLTTAANSLTKFVKSFV